MFCVKHYIYVGVASENYININFINCRLSKDKEAKKLKQLVEEQSIKIKHFSSTQSQ